MKNSYFKVLAIISFIVVGQLLSATVLAIYMRGEDNTTIFFRYFVKFSEAFLLRNFLPRRADSTF